MATTYHTNIQKLYVAYFNRPADFAGLNYWETVVEAANGNTAAVSAAFAASAEYTATYGNLDAYHVVGAVYQNLFGHAADVPGLTFWAEGLIAGKFTVADAVTAIAAGAQGTDATAYNNKVTAATAFTAALDTTAEILAYSGTAANLAAKTFIASITTDASLTAALVPATLDASVSVVVGAGTPAPVVQTFTLTTGIDVFTGGTGNDTFTADNSTASVMTSVADILNGGAGTDSLTIYGFNHTTDAVPQISNIENIILNTSAAGATISLANATGVSSVTVKDAAGATDTTVASGVTVTLESNDDATTAQVVDFGATATSASLILNGVSTNTTKDVEAQGAAVTTLNIATTGAASTVGQLEVDAAMATVVVTGDKNLTITDAVEEAVEVFNASAFTGKLSVTFADQTTAPDALTGTVDVADLTVTGGSGADTINVASLASAAEIVVNAGAGDDTVTFVKTATATLTASTSTRAADSLVGGDGTDTLVVDGALSADLTGIVSGFETLKITAASTMDMDANKLGITNFIIDADTTLSNLGATTTVTINDTGVDLTATLLSAGTADALTVTLVSNTTTGSAVIADSHDVLNVVSSKAAADASTVVNELENTSSATAAAALNISGTQDLVIQSIALKSGATVANTSSGAVTATFSTSVKSYSGSSAADSITVLAGDLKQGNTYAGGAGTDALTVTATAAQDLGIVGLTGFETLNLTTSGANVGDFRNVTDLATVSVTAGAGTDDLTLNRLSTDTTLSFTASIDQVVTTLNAGTSQKVAFSAAATVTNITLDSGTTSLTVTSDNGNATADEAMGVFTDIDGTSLASITVLGKDRTNLGTLETTTTSVTAASATGGLTVTASGTATTIVGGSAADTITGGGAADTITGGDGIDTISGGAGADTYVFAATGALNDADVLTIVASSDILNFSAFLSGGSVDVNGATGTAINEYTSANVSDVAIANKVVMYSDADETLIDGADEIALLIQGAGDAFSLASGGKAIMITGDAGGSAGDEARVWFINDALDGTLGTIGTADVVLVGVTSGDFDVDTLINTQFTFS